MGTGGNRCYGRHATLPPTRCGPLDPDDAPMRRRPLPWRGHLTIRHGYHRRADGLVHRVDPGDRSELDENVAQVALDRGFGDPQPVRYLGVTERLGGHFENLPLPFGERAGRYSVDLREAFPRHREHDSVAAM